MLKPQGYISDTLYLDSSEKVGIGKSNPDEKLTIHAGHVSMSQGYGLIRHHTSAGNQQNYGFYPFLTGMPTSFSNITPLNLNIM